MYPIRGSLMAYQCDPVSDLMENKGKSCTAYPWPKSEGRCWKTNFKDWKCSMSGNSGTKSYDQPGPATY